MVVMMMARFDRVILLVATRTVGRTGRVIWRADRKMRARGEALRVRRQSTVRASFLLRFELRVEIIPIEGGPWRWRAEQNKASGGERRNQ